MISVIFHSFDIMKKSKIIKIGKITRDQLLKSERKISREIELESSTGWTCMHKTHKSKKTYTRNPKYKTDY